VAAAAGELAVEVEHLIEARGGLVGGHDERGDHDGASVDERVVRQTLLVEAELIEGPARRLVPDVLVDGRTLSRSLEIACQTVVQRLARRLEAKVGIEVAHTGHLAVNVAKRDAVQRRVDLGQLRYIVRDSAAVQVPRCEGEKSHG